MTVPQVVAAMDVDSCPSPSREVAAARPPPPQKATTTAPTGTSGFAALNKMEGAKAQAVGRDGMLQPAQDKDASTWEREAEESALRLKVENALKHIRDGKKDEGKKAFEEVLGLHSNTIDSAQNQSKIINQLRFVAARNLAKLLEEESLQEKEEKQKLRTRALELYVDAVGFDGSDVVVWHRLGTLAQEMNNLALARFAFAQGLLLSPKHQILLEKYFLLCKSLADLVNATRTANTILSINPHHREASSWISEGCQMDRIKQGGLLSSDKNHYPDTSGEMLIDSATEHNPSQIDLLGFKDGKACSNIHKGTSFVEVMKTEVIRTDGGSVADVLDRLVKLWELHQKGQQMFVVELDFQSTQTESNPEEQEEETPQAPAKEVEKDTAQEQPNSKKSEEAEKDDTTANAVGGGGETDKEDANKGKKRKAEDQKQQQPEAPARRSRRVQTLQKEKEEKEKIEIQKVAEKIVTMTSPDEYLSQLQASTKRLDEVIQQDSKTKEKVLESVKSSAMLSDAKEQQFLEEFSKKHSGPIGVESAIMDLVCAISLNAIPLAPALQSEGMRSALTATHKILQHCDISTECMILLMEIYLDCMIEEGQKKQSYSSKRAKASTAAKAAKEGYRRMVKSISRRLDVLFVIGEVSENVTMRYYWNQTRFLRLEKKDDTRCNDYFQLLKDMIAKKGEKFTELLPWCKRENCISIEALESTLESTDADLNLHGCKLLYGEGKFDEIVKDLAPKLILDNNPLPLQTADILDDKANLAALTMLMDASHASNDKSRVDLLCAVRLLLAVFVNDSSDTELSSSLSVQLRKCINVIKDVMVRSLSFDFCESLQLSEIMPEISFIKGSFRSLLHRCYSKLFQSGPPSSSTGSHTKLESPHSPRNQLVDASQGLFACNSLQLIWLYRKNGRSVEQIQAKLRDTINLLASIYNLNMEAHAHKVRDGFFLESSIHTLRLFSTMIGDSGLIAAIKEELSGKVDEQLKLMIYSMYGIDLGLSETSPVVDSPGIFSFSCKQSCVDIWPSVYQFSQTCDNKQLNLIELCFKEMVKYFPSPPDSIMANYKSLLDDTTSKESDILCEEFTAKLQNLQKSNEEALAHLPEVERQIYKNLYRLLIDSQAKLEKDTILRSCKVYAGHAITNEGHSDIFKDSMPFENCLAMSLLDAAGWLNLSVVYDQAKDLVQNDAAKLIPASQWSTNQLNLSMIKDLRSKIRSCLLISYNLVKFDKSETTGECMDDDDDSRQELLEMLALTMYDTIQNAPPEYNQKDSVPAKDSDYQISLDMACRFYNELKVHRPTDWRLCLGLGKIMEKLHRLEDALMEYEKAISSAKNLLEPLYRIHTCRLKELLKAIEIGASVSGGAEKMMLSVSFLPDEESKRAIELRKILDEKFGAQGTPSEVLGGITDAMCALHFCIDIHKYHYPAICRLAKTYWTLGLKEKALAMITSCFKKGKEPFSINMWEDQALCSIKKPTGYSKDYKIGRAPDVISGIGREESSRKFVSKVRKALMFYIEVLSEYKDVETLDAIREFLTKTKQWRCLSDLSKQLNPSVASIKPLETSPDQNVTPLVIAPMAEPTDNTTADNQGLSMAIDDCMMIISNDDPEPPKMIP